MNRLLCPFEIPIRSRTVHVVDSDEQDTPQPDLNAIGLRVPRWHDALKLPLPQDLYISGMQFIQKERLWQGADLVRPGDKVYLVGYSYWYSVQGMQHPTPVVLTGFTAGTGV
jgi:hypothetical protein